MSGLGEDLVTTALLGTARRPVDPTTLPGRLGALARRLPGEDPAATLLDAAALVAVARRAGTPATTVETLPATAPAQDAPVAPPAAAARLTSLLPGTVTPPDRLLLLTWLRAAAAAGFRAPEQHLPALLDLATSPGSATDLRPAILAVLGRRGRWLAEHRPDWAARLLAGSPTGVGEADVWAHGSSAERLEHLSRLRSDEPAAARDLLTATWSKETAQDRDLFLGRLRRGLSLDDAPLLERALRDRAAGVRATALELLALVPGAAPTQAITARATACLRAERRLLRRSLTVTLPNPGAQEPFEPAPRGTGEKAWLLRRLLAATPLTVWPTHLGAEPAELVALTRGAELGDVVRAGWADAAIAQRDPRWAAAMLDAVPVTADLVTVLQPAARDAYLARLLRADQPGATPVSLALLAAAPDPWPAQVTSALLAWAAVPRQGGAHHPAMVLAAATEHLAPTQEVEAALRTVVEDLPPDIPWRHQVRRTADKIHTRRMIAKELT